MDIVLDGQHLSMWTVLKCMERFLAKLESWALPDLDASLTLARGFHRAVNARLTPVRLPCEDDPPETKRRLALEGIFVSTWHAADPG
jgi:hypothetical protein